MGRNVFVFGFRDCSVAGQFSTEIRSFLELSKARRIRVTIARYYNVTLTRSITTVIRVISRLFGYDYETNKRHPKIVGVERYTTRIFRE